MHHLPFVLLLSAALGAAFANGACTLARVTSAVFVACSCHPVSDVLSADHWMYCVCVSLHCVGRWQAVCSGSSCRQSAVVVFVRCHCRSTTK